MHTGYHIPLASHEERTGLNQKVTHYVTHCGPHTLVKSQEKSIHACYRPYSHLCTYRVTLPTQMRTLFVRIQHTGLNQKLHCDGTLHIAVEVMIWTHKAYGFVYLLIAVSWLFHSPPFHTHTRAHTKQSKKPLCHVAVYSYCTFSTRRPHG